MGLPGGTTSSEDQTRQRPGKPARQRRARIHAFAPKNTCIQFGAALRLLSRDLDTPAFILICLQPRFGGAFFASPTPSAFTGTDAVHVVLSYSRTG